MLLTEAHYLVHNEQYKDLRRDVARHQLIRIAMLRQPDNSVSLGRMIGWIGTQMVKWGSKLERKDHQRQTS